jgi:hypothetical protein
VTVTASNARTLTGLWACLLLAPCAWAAALGMLFSLTDEACVRADRAGMWTTAVVCTVLVLLPAVVSRLARSRFNADNPAGERARFLLTVSQGASLVFAPVMLLTTLAIGLLDSCRT